MVKMFEGISALPPDPSVSRLLRVRPVLPDLAYTSVEADTFGSK